MKRLVIGYSSLIDPQFRVMLEEAERCIEVGEDVLFAYCNGVAKCCMGNGTAAKARCTKCRLLNFWFLRRFQKRARVLRFPHGTEHTERFEYKSADEIKSITYKGVNIGYGAFSTWSLFTRDLLEEITPQKRIRMDFLLNQACIYADCAHMIMDSEHPDSVSVYNARLLETRAFFDVARARGVPVRINEVVLDDSIAGKKEFKLFYFDNAFPQDVNKNKELLDELWSSQGSSIEQKKAKAEDFFHKRRGGLPTTDTFNPGAATTYLKHQVAGALPSGFDSKKKNIAIFNSSEDEYISIDAEFESYALYKRQYDGIRAVLDAVRDAVEYHVYLRIHPNLAQVNQPYHTKLYALPKEYPNLTVVGATDKCSSYALMEACCKIVVFGSTIGAEATYWGKPVIQLGSSLYSLLDVAYRPRSFVELQALLKEPLSPKPQSNAIKYGYYLCGRIELATPAKHIDMGLCDDGEFKSIPTWPKILGSAARTQRLRWPKRMERPLTFNRILAPLLPPLKFILPKYVYDRFRRFYHSVRGVNGMT